MFKYILVGVVVCVVIAFCFFTMTVGLFGSTSKKRMKD